MITTRVAYEAALAVYQSYQDLGRTSGDDFKFLFELAYQIGEYERNYLA